MARGYPDYFGQQQFPYYGEPHTLYNDTGVIPAGTGSYLFDIRKKGKIIFGNVRVVIAGGLNLIIVSLWVDGFSMGNVKMTPSLLNNYTVKDTATIYLTGYNLETKTFNMGISPNITFGERVYVYITNDSLDVVNAEGNFSYFTVE